MFYDKHVFFCTNRRAEGNSKGCCATKGSEALVQRLKLLVKESGLENVRINTAGCLNRCHLGPVCVVYPTGKWYTLRNSDDVSAFFKQEFQDIPASSLTQIADDA